VNVYSGGSCTSGSDGGGGDAGTGTLTPGGTAPATPLTHGAAASPFSLNTSSLGWSAGSYGQSSLIGIAVVDTAGNVSPLSNVVCVTHVQVSGFWDSYCAAHGMTDTTACANNYRGCSVALPSRREDPVAIGLGALAVGLFLVRRRRR
jgi:MYXO-CTERM domain-containing protein